MLELQSDGLAAESHLALQPTVRECNCDLYRGTRLHQTFARTGSKTMGTISADSPIAALIYSGKSSAFLHALHCAPGTEPVCPGPFKATESLTKLKTESPGHCCAQYSRSNVLQPILQPFIQELLDKDFVSLHDCLCRYWNNRTCTIKAYDPCSLPKFR